MAESHRTDPNPFVLQKQSSNSSQQPLEVYHLSHDLRGPLNSMLGFTELLLEGIEGPLNDIQMEDVAAIRQSAQNLLQLINNLVDLSKLEADKVPLALEAVDLVDVIHKTRDHKARAPRPTPVELIVNIPASLPPVRGDRDRIEQMISNLLSFMLQIKNEGQIDISATYDEQNLTIRVVAAGAFLPTDELAELFDLTVKVDAAGRSKLGQGGLTLPLVQRLVQKHQGRLWVVSEANVGTAFYLELPLDQRD